MSDGEPRAAAPLVPIAEMSDEALARYRGSLARRTRYARPSLKRDALRSILDAATAEEVARKRGERGGNLPS